MNMAKSDDADRMRLLLIESITTLCRSGIHYSESLKVEGLLAITIDEGDVMVVNVNKEYEVPGAKKSTEEGDVESGVSSPASENVQRKTSVDSSSGASPGRAHKRSLSQDSSSHKKTRQFHSDSDNLQAEGNWSVSDSSRDSQSQNQGPSQYTSHTDQSYIDPGGSAQETSKAQIKIEIMDSESEEGDSSMNLFDTFGTSEGQLMSSSDGGGMSMYPGAGYNQPVAGPSGATTFTQILPTQTMGSPTVVGIQFFLLK